jgi:uncharacterized protein (TIGR03083 family)
MGEVAEAYAGCRMRITGLTRGLDDSVANARVAACPQWSVHDVIAHLSGAVDDVLAGRLEGIASDEWTGAQVEARRDRTIDDMLASWDAQAEEFENLLDDAGAVGRQGVTDIVTHEHDLRGALGQPGARESDAVRIGARFVAPGLVHAASERGIVMRIATTDGWSTGSDDTPVALEGTPFDLLRAITGRRNEEQLHELKWTGDYEPVIAAFTWGPFRPAVSRIDE